MDDIVYLIDKLARTTSLTKSEMLKLLSYYENENIRNELAQKAREVVKKIYGQKVYIRGLIEFSNYCQNDCYYCGIRRSNHHASRYRLSKEDILECCQQGYALGFRTFVLQSGEDLYYSDDILCDMISSIHRSYPDCAITLSLGEKERESFQRYFDAGAERYLLRHETANEYHYGLLHPQEMSLQHRKKCLYDLKEIGYQVGCGIMVGSPYQKLEYIVEDIEFMKKLQPHMIGIGPFIPHHQTPFAQKTQGSFALTLMLLSVLRLSFPKVLLPATTALATIHPQGREKGILSGANVVMPNLSPLKVRKKYELYNDKAYSQQEGAEGRLSLSKQLESIGYEVLISRGDHKEKENENVQCKI